MLSAHTLIITAICTGSTAAIFAWIWYAGRDGDGSDDDEPERSAA